MIAIKDECARESVAVGHRKALVFHFKRGKVDY